MTKTLEALVNGVNDRMDGYTVTPREVRKNNDLVLQGLIIGKEGEMVAPTVYVNRHLDKIEKHEMSVNEAVDDIVQMVIKSEQEHSNDFDDIEKIITDKAEILKRVHRAVCNTEKNADRLKGMPHKDFLDLSITYRIFLSDSGTIEVKDELTKHSGVTLEELDEAGRKNDKDEWKMANLSELMGPLPDGIDEPPFIVLTNRKSMYGAGIIADEEFLQKVAERIGGDFFILPSSVHEVLALPDMDGMNPDDLTVMVKEVNAREVTDDEVLADHVYKFENGKVISL